MTASLRQQQIRVDPVAVFVARCEARALLWQADEISLHDAVDELWAAAVRDGLVAKLGADEVQRLLADAFAPVRDDHHEDAVLEPLDAEPASLSGVPIATLQAAEYLVEQGDAEHFRKWLAKYNSQECEAIIEYLRIREARRCRSHGRK
jgi:hypothetical protein